MLNKKTGIASWGASVRGPGHTERDLPNQDSFLIRTYRWGVVAVVSDGLGSKRFSHIGSAAACRAVVKAIEKARENKEFDAADLLELIRAYWLVELAPLRSKDCSATCLFTYINDESVVIGRLGDGMIGLLGKDGHPDRVFSDDKEDSFANTTHSLTSTSALRHWEILRLSRTACTALVLCTDGVSADIANGKEAAFMHELYASTKEKRSKKNSLECRHWLTNWPTKGHSDDKTLVFLGGV